MRKYFAQLKENEEKGFSLVELIIVIAIMAILVGIVASQVIPYMEKSRKSKDQQIVSGIVTDMVSAIAQAGSSVDSDIPETKGYANIKGLTSIGADDAGNNSVGANFSELQGTSGTDPKTKFKSKAAKNKDICISYNASNGKVTGYPDGCSGDSKLVVVSD